MFGMGMPEIILILAVGLIVIGPKKLPELAKSLGKGIVEFKRASQDFRDTINVENEVEDLRETVGSIKHDIKNQITEKPETIKNSSQSTELAESTKSTESTESTESTSVKNDADSSPQLTNNVSNKDTSPQSKDTQPTENHEK
ncbi:sec-independent protein translocase protein TatB [Candidatus Magnetomorum sp. HK-1]|nr:sec-independent protein translocase protein TatB [Candidatus Magnetomorum sp. HK-1]